MAYRNFDEINFKATSAAGKGLFSIWAERAQRRSELRALLASADSIFSDIGVQRMDVVREARKPFWRA